MIPDVLVTVAGLVTGVVLYVLIGKAIHWLCDVLAVR